jgi:hypothetical protein
VRGLEQADSLAFDLHKWVSLPFDIGCLLVRDAALHKATFATEASYRQVLRWHHVVWQLCSQEVTDSLGIHCGSRSKHQITDKLLLIGVSGEHYHRAANRRVCRKGRFNLFKLDAHPPQLHLIIRSAQILNGAVGQIAPQIACSVQPVGAAIGKRAGEEAFTGEFRPVPITSRQAIPANEDLSMHPNRNALHTGVQYVHSDIGYGPPDWNR